MSKKRLRNNSRIVFGVTVGASAFSFFRGQLAWFKDQGWDPILVSSPGDQANATADREKVRFQPISMERGISPVKDLSSLACWAKFLHAEKPIAVCVGTPKAGLLGIIAAWAVRVPTRMYVVRGLRLEGASGILAKLLWLMERLTIRLATDVFFVSESLFQEAKERKLIDPEKSWLIGSGSSNGVDAAAILQRTAEVDRDELRSHYGFTSEDLVVGFIGRISFDKGAGVVLDLAKAENLPESIKFLMVGAIEDESLGKILEQGNPRIKYLPWSDDVWGLLPAIDVLTLPTVREGFPNVVLEAAAAGIPTITTRATGAIDSVRVGETGWLIDIGDVDGLRGVLCQILEFPNQLEEIGVKAQTVALTEFNPEVIWKGMLEILNREKNPIFSRLAK